MTPAAVIAERRLLAVIRAGSAAAAVETARAALAGGVTVLEVAYTTPDAAVAIRTLATETSVLMEPPLLGAGTVLNERQAAEAVAAGARFLVSPGVVPEVIACARRLGAAALPGAATVTEVLAALEAGADLVKLFPAEVLGLKFLKAVRTVLPAAGLVPTGGISAASAGEWLEAGAVAVGGGGGHTAGDPALVRRRAGELVRAVAAAAHA
jgi:2-dehydro-3-deoxyphosphogluconate aldolase/(4S)-4-hydroxy-2-oxoglutarate aldolase